mmetsp:Transcript_26416/g.40328  ORF Transcript_26416/g.40328 Transcript_26416/m.40328 type:complete len:88 (-) Transcript_26416:258-521(-)
MDADVPQKPINTHWVAGSITTWGRMNPSFTVFDIDAEYMVPTNVHTYAMNLTEANIEGAPQWKYLHDFVSEYSLPDFSPSSLLDLTH